MQRRALVLAGPAIALGLAHTGCSMGRPIKLGFLGGLSGKFADLGIAERNGVLLAVDEANRQGGVNGAPIELIERDDAQDVEQGKAKLRELADRGVLAVIGPATSSIGVAIAPLAAELGLLLVSPTVTTASMTGKDDALVRVCSDAAAYGAAAAKAHSQYLQVRRYAVLMDVVNADYVRSWAGAYVAAGEGLGMTAVRQLEFKSTELPNHEALARQLLSDSVEMVVLVCSSVDASLAIQKLRALNTSVKLAGSGWASTERTLELAGRAADGAFFEQYFNRFDGSARFVTFTRLYQERFQQPPGYAGLLAADAANVVIRAAVKGATRATLKSMLVDQVHEGIQDPIPIDRFGDASRAIHFTVVKDGQFAKTPWPTPA